MPQAFASRIFQQAPVRALLKDLAFMHDVSLHGTASRAAESLTDAGKGPALRALDWLNFLLADVQGGLGPFLAVYLWSSQGWDATQVGIIMTVAGIATVVARAPAGALVDGVIGKRSLIVAAAGSVALGGITLSLFPSFWPVAAAQTVIGACDAVFPPAIAAISLGVAGRKSLARRRRCRNIRRAAASAAWGTGAALSNSVAGFIVDSAGFNAAVLFLAAIAVLAFLMLLLFVPETRGPTVQAGAAYQQPALSNPFSGAE
jgi:MFS family permease